MTNEELQQKAAEIRLEGLKALHRAGLEYSGSCMSVVEILVALYYEVMKYDVRRPGSLEQDYLVMGKGQAVAMQYAILADLGFFDKAEMRHLAKVNGVLQGRPYAKVPGVTLGNLGHGNGLSLGLGLALCLQMERKHNKVFTVLGDGELQDGQIWEAAQAAAHYKLGNLICIVDDNKVQGGGLTTSVLEPQSIQGKFDAFGWKVIQVRNGHDYDELIGAVQRAYTTLRKPVCIWAHTVSGKGIGFAEGKPFYQSAGLSDQEMQEIQSIFSNVQ